jgi:HEAT repeat protein
MDLRRIQIAYLILRLRSNNPDVQERVTKALVRIGKPAVRWLLKSINMTSNMTMSTSFSVPNLPGEGYLLKNLPPDEAIKLARARFDSYQNHSKANTSHFVRLKQVLVRMGKPTWDEMMYLADNSPRGGFLRAVDSSMSDFGDTVSVDDVLAALQHNQYRVRVRAAYMLAKRDDPRVVPTLEAMIRQPDGTRFTAKEYEDLRATGARALAGAGDAGVQVLIDAAHDDDPQVREAVTFGLMWVTDVRAFDSLAELIQSPDRNKVWRAIVGFDRMADKLSPEQQAKVMSWLTAWMSAPSDNMFDMSSANRLIEKLGSVAVEPLLAQVNDVNGSDYSRYQALSSLGILYKKQPNLPMREKVMVSVLSLTPALNDLEQVAIVAYVLNEAGDERAIPYLQDLHQRLKSFYENDKGKALELCEMLEHYINQLNLPPENRK